MQKRRRLIQWELSTCKCGDESNFLFLCHSCGSRNPEEKERVWIPD